MNAYTPVIGLEIHAELLTRSKMFCACPVVDVTTAAPNSAVCPVCAGLPGSLPVLNRRAVEFALRVALSLECEIYETSVFERKNYFYPDLPKGFQISQYQQPLARNGRLPIRTSQGERVIRIRRVHLEEDTGKSTHFFGEAIGDDSEKPNGEIPTELTANRSYSLIDLNRSGVPLLEIVTEPDMHSAEEVGIYARELRRLLRYLDVNSGDMEKGVLRIEPNISVRPADSGEMGTRTEVKNLNSFRALERAVDFEIRRQIEVLEAGGEVIQETVGWDETRQETFSQRGKEDAHDYRYFPEPDLPPLVVGDDWRESVRASLPELPHTRQVRYTQELGLGEYDASILTSEKLIANYFETVLEEAPDLDPKLVSNWITGELFSLLNESGAEIGDQPVAPEALAELLGLLEDGTINQASGKKVLGEMFAGGKSAREIVEALNLSQVSDSSAIAGLVDQVLESHPKVLQEYLDGKETVANWLFGQVMRAAQGRANPAVVRSELEDRLESLKKG